MLGLFESFVYVADEVADVAATVEEGDHRLLGGVFGGGVVGGYGGVPFGPEGFQLLLRFGEHGGEVLLGLFEILAGLRVVFAHFFGHAHLLESHVEFEGFFEEVGWGDLFLLGAGGFGGVGGGAGLLFELDAFEGEEVFGAGDGCAEGAVGVVEL